MVYGVGINDCPGWSNHCTEEQKLSLNYRTYNLWTNMLNRCYCDKTLSKHPTYKDCFVCERWLTLSNFAEDIKHLVGYELWKNNPKQQIMLDKDIIVNGNKEYKPETCCFVTAKESCLDVINRCKEKIYSAEAIALKAKALSKAVICTFADGREQVFSSAIEAERTAGFNHSTVSAICMGKGRKTHHGCKFRYA